MQLQDDRVAVLGGGGDAGGVADHVQAHVGEFFRVVECAEEGGGGREGERGGGAVAEEGGGVGVGVRGGAGVGEDLAGVGDDQLVYLDALGVDAEVERAPDGGPRGGGGDGGQKAGVRQAGNRWAPRVCVRWRKDEFRGSGVDVVIGRPVVVRAPYRVSTEALMADLRARYEHPKCELVGRNPRDKPRWAIPKRIAHRIAFAGRPASPGTRECGNS